MRSGSLFTMPVSDLLNPNDSNARTDRSRAAGYSSKNQPYSPASGGADGSLLLNDGEIGRSINDPLQGYRDFLLGKYNLYKSKGVGAADFVQAAGNLGTRSCPGGPAVKTVSNTLLKNRAIRLPCSTITDSPIQVIGREDSTQAAPEGTLPQAFGPQSKQEVLIQLWADKGISPRELAALMGAHSVSRAFVQQANGIPAGSKTLATTSDFLACRFRLTRSRSAG
jgi:hypothetical protein